MTRVTARMDTTVRALLLLAVSAATVQAQEPVQREHVVRDGDTLWDLSAYYYADPFNWPTIYEANTTVVEDPHWIYPDEVLIIPGIAGDTEPAPEVGQVPVAVTVVQQPAPPARTVFYRSPPERPSDGANRPTVLSEPAPVVVPVRHGEFVSAPWVGDPDDLEVLGTFIRALRENRDVGGSPTAHLGDAVFLGYASTDRPAVGDRLVLVDVGGRVSGTPGGTRLIQPTGIVAIEALEEDVIVARIDEQFGEVYRGQVAIPMFLYPDFMVERAQPIETDAGYDLAGELVMILNDPPLPSRADVGFVNLGSADGVNVGDLFTAYLPERAAREREAGDFLRYIERLPPEAVAVLRVIQLSDAVATVRIDRIMVPQIEPGMTVRRTHTVQ